VPYRATSPNPVGPSEPSDGGVTYAAPATPRVGEPSEEGSEPNALLAGEEEEVVVVRGRGAPAELRAVARRAVRWATAAAAAGATLGAATAHAAAAVVGSTAH